MVEFVVPLLITDESFNWLLYLCVDCECLVQLMFWENR